MWRQCDWQQLHTYSGSLLPTWRTTAQLFRGESAVLHEKYDPNSDDYDIAVIRLPSPLTYNDKVQPVCIPSAPVADGTECVVTGWGDTQNPAEDNNVLRQVVVPIINLDTCRNLSEDYADLTQNMLCAGLIEGGKDACIGDSGGPLVCKQGDGWFQYGIVSYGFGCAEPNYPGVYADVFTLHPWIQEQTRKSAKEVVVNYDTSLGEYIMSMTIIEDAGPRDAKEIRKMLLGSRNVWKSTCQRIVPHVLEIEPTVDCRGEDWTVQHLSFKVMAVKWVEIYVDDQKVFSRIVGLYFTFSQEILTPGRKLKIVFYPKWRFPSLILFDVEIVFVCNEYQN